MKPLVLATCLGLCLPASAQAEFSFDAPEQVQSYVDSNLLGIFYHELGHALIDVLGLPIFGQEEDAADVLSVFLLDAFYDEDAAVELAYHTAFGFLGDAAQRQQTGSEPAYWDVHGPDLQRYFNLICIFYGANPDERSDVAIDLGLPADRAEYCPVEYDQANGSWGAVLDEIAHPNGGRSFRIGTLDITSDGAELTAQIVEDEVEALNAEFRLPDILTISVKPCGQPNAFYDPSQREIVMCTEFSDYLADWAPK